MFQHFNDVHYLSPKINFNVDISFKIVIIVFTMFNVICNKFIPLT